LVIKYCLSAVFGQILYRLVVASNRMIESGNGY
jgi:hypothetical protein